MEQKFILEVNASSQDGEEIKCEIKASVSCTQEMAVGVMVNVLKKNSDLKEIVVSAMLAILSGNDNFISEGTDIDITPIDPDTLDL